MQITPFRFRTVAGKLLVTNEAGDYGFFQEDILERFFEQKLLDTERKALRDLSIAYDDTDNWRLVSLMRRIRSSHVRPRRLTYLIVIPTLRCDLSCTYCQVSRAPLDAAGFDWGSEQIAQFEKFIDNIDSDHLKLEFQGGEPSLRPDLISRLIEICSRKFKNAEYAICTNLTRLSAEIEAIYSRSDVVISTSIDGPLETMTINRTASDDLSRTIFQNFEYLVKKYGPQKVSALPTITDAVIRDPKGLIDLYRSLGFESIFLRPVNFMGFARKKHTELSRDFDAWNSFHRSALDYIVEINQSQYFEEFYTSLFVRTIFGGLRHGYVDLRSPSAFASDYCVIDFDGALYPSDEARMLSRTRTIDLSIGTMERGFDQERLNDLNFHAVNQTHPDCVHCAYMPFCGIDVVDDISRYGRSDIPKHETWFCKRQISLFDLIFEKVATHDRRYLSAFLKWIYRSEEPPASFELFHD